MAAFPFDRWPRILRALLAQGVAFALLVGLGRLGLRLPAWAWAGLQGGLAALLGSALGLPPWWLPLQALLPAILLLRLASPQLEIPAGEAGLGCQPPFRLCERGRVEARRSVARFFLDAQPVTRQAY